MNFTVHERNLQRSKTTRLLRDDEQSLGRSLSLTICKYVNIVVRVSVVNIPCKIIITLQQQLRRALN